MPRLLLLLALLATAAPGAFGHAAPLAPPDTLDEAHGWLREITVGLTASRVGHHAWQEGGVNSLSAALDTRGLFRRVNGDFRQRHEGRFAFGMIRQDTLDFRKGTDVLRYAFDVQYTGFGSWLPTFATELRTQVAPGFDYDPSPTKYPPLADRIVPGERLKVSDFFAPATWVQSLGIAYEREWLRARTGLGLKQSIVLIERLQPVYGNEPGQPVRLQAGLDGLLELRGEPMHNVRVQTRLTVFQAFTQVTEAAPDVMWETNVRLRINDWLAVTGEFVALYDRDVINRIQLKDVLSLGLHFDFG
jgi:hypothetical protein